MHNEELNRLFSLNHKLSQRLWEGCGRAYYRAAKLNLMLIHLQRCEKDMIAGSSFFAVVSILCGLSLLLNVHVRILGDFQTAIASGVAAISLIVSVTYIISGIYIKWRIKKVMKLYCRLVPDEYARVVLMKTPTRFVHWVADSIVKEKEEGND